MEITRQKQAIGMIMPLFLHLLASNHYLKDFFINCTFNLLLLTYHYLFIFKPNWIMFGMSKTTATVITVTKVCSSLTVLDVIWSSLRAPSLLIINFEQVYPEIFFLFWNIYFTFLCQLLIILFYKNNFDMKYSHSQNKKAAGCRWSSKYVFLKASPRENTCAGDSF